MNNDYCLLCPETIGKWFDSPLGDAVSAHVSPFWVAHVTWAKWENQIIKNALNSLYTNIMAYIKTPEQNF